MATRKSQRRSVEDIAPVSSPFAEFLAQIQAGKLPQTDALASAIAGVQSKLGEWRPSGEQDPFAFLFDRTLTILLTLGFVAPQLPWILSLTYVFRMQN